MSAWDCPVLCRLVCEPIPRWTGVFVHSTALCYMAYPESIYFSKIRAPVPTDQRDEDIVNLCHYRLIFALLASTLSLLSLAHKHH